MKFIVLQNKCEGINLQENWIRKLEMGNRKYCG